VLFPFPFPESTATAFLFPFPLSASIRYRAKKGMVLPPSLPPSFFFLPLPFSLFSGEHTISFPLSLPYPRRIQAGKRRGKMSSRTPPCLLFFSHFLLLRQRRVVAFFPRSGGAQRKNQSPFSLPPSPFPPPRPERTPDKPPFSLILFLARENIGRKDLEEFPFLPLSPLLSSPRAGPFPPFFSLFL